MRAVKSLEFGTLGSFCPKQYRSTEELCLMTLKSNAKFEEKLSLSFKNDMMNLVHFNGSSGKSEDLHFDVLFLSIAYKVFAKKVQKNHLSWNWKAIKTLKENWLFVWKMTWGIWWILAWAVGSPKNFTLVGYFWRKCVMLELQKYSGDVPWKMIEEFGEFSHK